MLKFRVGSQSCLDADQAVDGKARDSPESRSSGKAPPHHPNPQLMSSLNVSLHRALSERKIKLESTPTPRRPSLSSCGKPPVSKDKAALSPSTLNSVVTSNLVISKITNTPDLKVRTAANAVDLEIRAPLNTPELKITKPTDIPQDAKNNEVKENMNSSQIQATPSMKTNQVPSTPNLNTSQLPKTPTPNTSQLPSTPILNTSQLPSTPSLKVSHQDDQLNLSHQQPETPYMKMNQMMVKPGNPGVNSNHLPDTPSLRISQPVDNPELKRGRALETPGLKISYIESPGVSSDTKLLAGTTPQVKLPRNGALSPGVSPKMGINCSTPKMFLTNPQGRHGNCSTPRSPGMNTSATQENYYNTPCNDDTEREPTYQSLVQTLPCTDENGNEVILTNTLTEMKCLTKDEHDNTRHKTGYLTYLTPNRFLSPIDRSSFLRSQVTFPEEEATWQDMTTIILCLLSLVMNSEFLFNFPMYLMRWRGEGVVIYIVMLLLIGLPLFIMEVLLGSSEKLSSLKIWSSMVPLMSGLGPALATAAIFLAAKTCVLMSYTMMYLISSASTPLPWTQCDSWWGPDSRCFSTAEIHHFDLNQSLLCTLYDLAGEDCHSHNIPSHVHFWETYVLQTDQRGLRVLGSLGSPNLNLVLVTGVIWICVSVTVLIPRRFLMKLISLFSLCTLGLVFSTSLWNIIKHEALAKLKEYLTMTDGGTMVNMDCYLEAFWLVITGMSLMNGGLVSYSCMLPKMRSVKLVSLTCVLLHLLYLVLVIATILPLVPINLDTDEMINKKEIGYFPLALMSLDLGQSQETSALTFMVYLAAVLAAVNLILGLSSSFRLLREFKNTRTRRLSLALAVFLTGFLITLPLTYQAGPSLVALYYVYGYKVPLYILAPVVGVSVFWLYGCKRLASRADGMMSNILLTAAWALKPVILIAIGCMYFVSGVPIPEPYPLPGWAVNIGIFLATCSILQVIAGALMTVLNWFRRGQSLVRAPANVKTFNGFHNRSISELCEMKETVKSNTYKSFDDILNSVNKIN